MPVSLNGDLKNQFVETTVGFDTVCKVSIAGYYQFSLNKWTLKIPVNASEVVYHGLSLIYVCKFHFSRLTLSL